MNQQASQEKRHDCEICDAISSRVLVDNGGRLLDARTINLGSFEDALSSQCDRHMSIIKWFHSYCEGQRSESRPSSKDVGVVFHRPGRFDIRESLLTLENSVELLLVRKEEVQNHPGFARIMDPDWVDVGVVATWMDRCRSSHGNGCRNPMRIWPTRPAWVVDTERRCLVPGKDCEFFVALSYRWGRAAGLPFQDDITFSQLQKPGALDDPAVSDRLAPIVAHAMSLTSKIGERYLWVDALCIDHSQAAESAAQLQLMGAIYANATLTIVAQDGDADYGLPGLQGASVQRTLPHAPVPFENEQFVADGSDFSSISSAGPYHERGWTFQEFKMSPRRLVFRENRLIWMCQRKVWDEQLHHGVEAEKYIEHRFGEIMGGMPNLASLGDILANYNERKLTYDEDALPGISGMLTLLSRTFQGGFLCGIPEMYFEAALAWKPHGTYISLRRRTPSNRPSNAQLRPNLLPSWSWIGWEGPVVIGCDEAGPAKPRLSEIRETIPITTWYACDSPTRTNKRRIRSLWFENRDVFKDFSKPLLSGWTRHPISAVRRPRNHVLLYPSGCEEFVFRHSSMAGVDYTYAWHWPFPVLDIQQSTQPSMPEQTPYICCETRRARAFGVRKGRWNEVSLYNSQGYVIGDLHLHNEQQLKRFPESAAAWSAGAEVELVAICRALCYTKTWNEQLKAWEHPFTVSERYTVLWVEWKDGIAYRQASGDVERSKWEALALEDVSLILG